MTLTDNKADDLQEMKIRAMHNIINSVDVSEAERAELTMAFDMTIEVLIDSHDRKKLAEERRRLADQIHHREAFLSNQYSESENVEVCHEIEARINEISHFKRWIAEAALSTSTGENPSAAQRSSESG